MPDQRVIDFRLRPPFRSLTNLNIWRIASDFTRRMRLTPEPSQDDRTMESCFREMDESGVAYGVTCGRITPDPKLSASNEDVRALADAHPKRIIPFGAISASIAASTGDQATQVLDRLAMRGIGIEPGYESEGRYADDPAYFGAYEVAQQRRAPVIITQSALLGPDLSYASAVPIGRVARQFPDLQIVIAHACWPYLMEACGVAFKHANVWLLPDVYAAAMPGHQAIVDAANSFLADRMLYGSAYPLLPIGQAVKRFLALPIRDDAIEGILYGNAGRLLGHEGGA